MYKKNYTINLHLYNYSYTFDIPKGWETKTPMLLTPVPGSINNLIIKQLTKQNYEKFISSKNSCWYLR